MFVFVTEVLAHSYADFVELDSSSDPQDMIVEHLKSTKTTKLNQLTVDLYLRNFTEADKAKVLQAKEILEVVMNSEEFKQRVINFTFKGEKRFHQNNGQSNQEIYDHLMTGEEILMPGSTGIMNFDLSLYKSKNPWSTVKGYTTADSMRIYINTKFYRLSTWTAIDVAANMAHEWVHKMGYGHDYKDNPDRPYTVPYAVGHIVGDVARELGF
jgi:hypothetical protein